MVRPPAKTMLRMVRFLLPARTHERGYRQAGGVVSKAQRALRIERPTDRTERIGQLLDDLTQSGAAIDHELALLAALVPAPRLFASRGHLQVTPPSIHARGCHADTVELPCR